MGLPLSDDITLSKGVLDQKDGKTKETSSFTSSWLFGMLSNSLRKYYPPHHNPIDHPLLSLRKNIPLNGLISENRKIWLERIIERPESIEEYGIFEIFFTFCK